MKLLTDEMLATERQAPSGTDSCDNTRAKCPLFCDKTLWYKLIMLRGIPSGVPNLWVLQVLSCLFLEGSCWRNVIELVRKKCIMWGFYNFVLACIYSYPSGMQVAGWTRLLHDPKLSMLRSVVLNWSCLGVGGFLYEVHTGSAIKSWCSLCWWGPCFGSELGQVVNLCPPFSQCHPTVQSHGRHITHTQTLAWVTYLYFFTILGIFFFLDLNLLTIYCGSSGTVSFLLLISWGYFSVPTLFYWWCFVCFHLPSPPVPAVSRGTLCLFLEHIQLLSPTVFSIDINCISNMHNSA